MYPARILASLAVAAGVPSGCAARRDNVRGLRFGLHRYRTFAGSRDADVLAQSFGEVVEAALRQRGTLRAPKPGNVTLIKAAS